MKLRPRSVPEVPAQAAKRPPDRDAPSALIQRGRSLRSQRGLSTRIGPPLLGKLAHRAVVDPSVECTDSPAFRRPRVRAPAGAGTDQRFRCRAPRGLLAKIGSDLLVARSESVASATTNTLERRHTTPGSIRALISPPASPHADCLSSNPCKRGRSRLRCGGLETGMGGHVHRGFESLPLRFSG